MPSVMDATVNAIVVVPIAICTAFFNANAIAANTIANGIDRRL